MINLKPVFALVITLILAVTTGGEKPPLKLPSAHRVAPEFGPSGKLFAQTQDYNKLTKALPGRPATGETLGPKLVTGDKSAQSYPFIVSGNARTGLVVPPQVLANR